MLKLMMVLNLLTFTTETVPNTPGTYPVIIEYADSEINVSEEIQFTIITEETIIVEEVAIDAHSFTIGSEKNLNEDLIIILSNAKAWNVENGEEYPIDHVEISKIDTNLYEATLYTVGEISKTIEIIVDAELYTQVVADEQRKTIFDKSFEEYYGFQIIAIASISILFILLIILSIVIFNTLINRTISKLNRSKNSVKSS